MYIDFEDYRPQIEPVGRALTGLERVLLSIIFHLVMVILILVGPKWMPGFLKPAPATPIALAQPRDNTTFVFVQPRVERRAPKAPPRAELSDIDRQAMTRERAPKPTNPLPFARGNTPDRIVQERQPAEKPRGQGPAPDPAAGQIARNQPAQPDTSTPPPLVDASSAMQFPVAKPAPQSGASGRSMTAGGALGDSLRNLQKYVQNETFDNQGGGGGQFGPEIQFDTKGVEFGPWIRRFIAQVKRNWFIPYAAMSMKGHVVITFNVHKDGSLTELSVVGPCPIDAFNNAAFGALVASNPTQPLPPEYPSEHAFFTVTFFYNEEPR